MASFFSTREVPKWLLAVNIINLLLIFGWPFVAFMSVFTLDAPNAGFWRYTCYILINLYPFFLVGNLIASIKFYARNKAFGIVLAFIPLFVCLCFAGMIAYGIASQSFD